MENGEMKKCPYCAEMIKAEAIKCRYCGSNLTSKKINLDFFTTPGYWHRVDEGKKIAGVCTGLAHQFDAPILIMPLRLFFILTTLFYGFGIILYLLLWILMSPPGIDVKYDNVSNTVPTHATASEYNKPEKPEQTDDSCFEIDEVTESKPEEKTENNKEDMDT